MKTRRKRLPENIHIVRGQTQKNVNKTILEELINRYDQQTGIKILDLPCGKLEFLNYVRILFPNSKLTGADIMPHPDTGTIVFHQKDLSKNFNFNDGETFDLITSISGIMMFGNTQCFIENCSKLLSKGGTLIITNDNPATIKDRISYLMLGRFRIFGQVFEDHETLTQLVLIQELVRLLRVNGIEITNVKYTSFYPKDLIYVPFALLVFPFQLAYLATRKTSLPKRLIYAKYAFRQMFCRHYIVYGKKV